MILYELAAADGRRFSPHCGKSRMSLAQLGIDAASEEELLERYRERPAPIRFFDPATQRNAA